MNRLFTVMVISFTVFLLPSLSLVAQSVRCDIVEGVYTVRIGDTFSSISRKLSVSIDQIRQLNSLESNSRLVVGQKLKITQLSEISEQPNQAEVVEKVYYTVRIGDTFASISRKLSVSVDQIRQLNSLESNSRLVVGQKLKYNYSHE